MLGQDTRNTERKIAAILKILNESPEPMGGRVISQKLKEHGVNLGERAVRYHLKLMDERGFTRCVGERDGREITPPGTEELKSTLVWDKLGLLVNKIEMLSYLTTYNPDTNKGNVPIDLAIFPEKEFDKAKDLMAELFNSDYCPSDLVAIAHAGKKLGETIIPEGKIGMATISNIIVNGLLLKSGIPIDSRFAGLIEVKNFQPVRFCELIEYGGSTLDPAEIFTRCRYTSVSYASLTGSGKVIAGYYEIPVISEQNAENLLLKLKDRGTCKGYILQKNSEPKCDVPTRMNTLGLILYSGLNPAASATESGMDVNCHAMDGTIDIGKLKKFADL